MVAKIQAHIREQQINSLPNISFVRWLKGYANAKSKAVCICRRDGFEWSASVDDLVNGGKGCPQCAGVRRWTEIERIEQINRVPNISFVRWDSVYKNAHSKAICRCDADGFQWRSSVTSLLDQRTGCPQCSGKRRWTSEERIAQINALPNITFLRWENGGPHTSGSKAVCQCWDCGHEWAAKVTHLVDSGSGCPKCAESGFNRSKPATLYILRSECGSMVKIGISNNHKQRHAQLRRRTPFDWNCVELLHSDDGSLIAELEKELHSWTEPVEFSEPFDGYTEWRKWDDRLPMWIKRYRARLARYNKAP